MSQCATAPCSVSTGESRCTCAGTRDRGASAGTRGGSRGADLRLPAGIDDVDLRGDLVSRPEPGPRHQRERRRWRSSRRTPPGRARPASPARSRPGRSRRPWRSGRPAAAPAARCVGDHRVERGGRPVDHRRVERAAQRPRPRARRSSARTSSACTRGGPGARSRVGVVDQHVLLDVRRRAGSRPGRWSRDLRAEVVEAAVGVREPGAAAVGTDGHAASLAVTPSLNARNPSKAITDARADAKCPRTAVTRTASARRRTGHARGAPLPGPRDRPAGRADRGDRRPRAHRRPGVRASTVAEVEQAIADLDRQRSQLRLTGRTFLSTW